MTAKRTGLATRLMTAQIIVIAVGAVTLLTTAALAAPILFHDHLAQADLVDPAVIAHAEQAFNSAFLLALVLGAAASLAAAGLMSWFLVRRVTPPLQRLAQAAESVANGNYQVEIPDDAFGSELQSLSRSFTKMSHRLEEIDKSRTRMLNDLAHEIRTPLATLEVFVDGMEDEVVPIEEQTYVVLHRQIARLRRLASDVRDAANASEHALGLHTGPVDLRHELELAAELARPQFQAKGITLTSTYQSTATTIAADEQRLQQVLTNVLSNALRHTPTGGSVSINASDEGDNVLIQVADTGDGIPPEELDDIFERFYRHDPSRTDDDQARGSGLGLTIARAITIEHGGSITAASAGLGHGTTITICLPRTP